MSDESKAALEAATEAVCRMLDEDDPGERRIALAAIRAYLDAAPGHQLVPRALTDDMRERADITDAEWRCALQAAPPPPGLEKEPDHADRVPK